MAVNYEINQKQQTSKKDLKSKYIPCIIYLFAWFTVISATGNLLNLTLYIFLIVFK